MTQLIELARPDLWPQEILDFLFKHEDDIRRFKTSPSPVTGRKYDEVVLELERIIGPCYLQGWHCTRLTKDEIEAIKRAGMTSSSKELLHLRIKTILNHGLIDENLANQLMENHRYNPDERREKMIWFCFSPPHLSGEDGIHDLLGFWGGEASYRGGAFDERVAQIGTPCIIEAKVKIEGLGSKPNLKMVELFLAYRDGTPKEHADFESYSEIPIPPEVIVKILLYPDEEFLALTQADTWDEPLMPAIG